jgi:hypothetical protein
VFLSKLKLFAQEHGMTEHIVAVFESDASVDAARALEGIGIPASAIRRYQDSQRDESGVGTSKDATSTTHSSGGFWAWLFGEEHYPHQDEDIYERLAQAGDTVLDVLVDDDSRIHQAVTILEAHEPAQIDERTDEAVASQSLHGDTAAGEAAGTTSLSPSGTDYSTSDVARPAGLSSTGVAPPASSGTEPAPAPDPVAPSSATVMPTGMAGQNRGAETEEVTPSPPQLCQLSQTVS